MKTRIECVSDCAECSVKSVKTEEKEINLYLSEYTKVNFLPFSMHKFYRSLHPFAFRILPLINVDDNCMKMFHY